MSAWRRLREALGIARSLCIFFGNRARTRRMAELYRKFVRPGDLVFDIGAHVGNGVAAFRRLGARVVAVEPQPAMFRFLKWRYGNDPAVALVEAAICDQPGKVTLHLNLANPVISTASTAFIAAARKARGWEGRRWEDTVIVAAVTLDNLIAVHGLPVFAKIDAEGFEAHAIAGLSEALPALSFEFTTIQREVAIACLDLLAALGDYRFNATLGESQAMVFAAAVSADAMAAYVRALPHEANSGDIHAFLPDREDAGLVRA